MKVTRSHGESPPMKKSRPQFKHDSLIRTVRACFAQLPEAQLPELTARHKFSNVDCLMAGLAVFVFKFSSLLEFDKQCHGEEKHTIVKSLERIFKIQNVPSDTTFRERVDEIDSAVFRTVYRSFFRLLQRGKVLDNYKFLEERFLVPLDGTQFFSSGAISCPNCCEKDMKNGEKFYYHQMLGAVIVHPQYKEVLPLCPEMIEKKDGDKKNDCERNAAKRWIEHFKREHPKLKITIVGDGLSSNAPFVKILQENDIKFILVAKESDHKYMFEWLNSADPEDAPTWTKIEREPAPKRILKKGRQDEKVTTHTYQVMKDVPLNASTDLKVTVVRYTETVNYTKGTKPYEETHTWVWVTDLAVNQENVAKIAEGGRARWSIENETFNTLKNQGYNFEHNYGHGNKNLSNNMAHLMMITFFMDQIAQALDKDFQKAWKHLSSKRMLWERIRSYLMHYIIDSQEAVYKAILDPPEKKELFA